MIKLHPTTAVQLATAELRDLVGAFGAARPFAGFGAGSCSTPAHGGGRIGLPVARWSVAAAIVVAACSSRPAPSRPHAFGADCLAEDQVLAVANEVTMTDEAARKLGDPGLG
jgi:hypothetical protein